MAYSFERTYELKQHTPLIHFQHTQDGATLRATEVKPKLDRYLIRAAGIPQDSPFRLRGSEGASDALNYKLSFSCGQADKVELGPKTDYDIYYGNMGPDREKYVKGVLARGKVTCRVVCLIPELMELIDRHLAGFFVVTNFGRMQRKGFGSFTVESGAAIPPARIASLLCKACGAGACYSFPGGPAPFRKIKALYGVMKSGYNFGGRYHKAFLFQYMMEKGIRSEKRGLKANGLAPKIWQPRNDRIVNHPGDGSAEEEQYRYVRALLGVADHVEYRGQAGTDRRMNLHEYRIRLADGSVEDRGRSEDSFGLAVRISSDKIERLKSPVFFKVIGGTVWYVAEKIPEEIYGEEFTFTSGWDDRAGRTGGPEKSVVFKVPTRREMGLREEDSPSGDFLEYVFSHYQRENLSDIRELQGLAIARHECPPGGN